ncbi:MAG: M28 family peptidase, partial [Emergencia timonensis]
ALNLELARICQKYREELHRDVVFAFWDGHEIAEGGGSTWYCDHYWKEMNENCIAYINIDNLAIKGTTIPGVEGQPELKQFLMDAIEKVWGVKGQWNHAYKGGGDSSFFGIGVPYVSFATEYTEAKLKELNYAFYSPWLHSDSDTIDKIDRELLAGHGRYFLYLLEQLVSSPLVPYDLPALAEDIEGQWKAICARAGRAKTLIEDLEEVFRKYTAALVSLTTLASRQECQELYNKLAILCERQTVMFRSESGRYGQDSCCALQTENPIPALDRAIKKYNQSEVGSHEFYLWETQILKVKNMVYDGLNNSLEYIGLGLSAIK